MCDELPTDVPRETQTLRLPPERLRAFREWAVEGTATSVLARVRDPDGRLAVVRNRWSDDWTLPGGAVEPGESPSAAVRREIREETGLTATVGEPLLVVDQTYRPESNTAVDGTPSPFEATQVVYAARANGEIPDASELGVGSDEIHAARWVETVPDALHDRELFAASDSQDDGDGLRR
ncbi:MAG: NUDIX hydrolase [Halobaculum sp.]